MKKNILSNHQTGYYCSTHILNIYNALHVNIILYDKHGGSIAVMLDVLEDRPEDDTMWRVLAKMVGKATVIRNAKTTSNLAFQYLSTCQSSKT